MDIDMPRLNGFTAARIIGERFPGTRVILMSASVAPEQRTLARSYGATGVVRKTRFQEDFTLALEECAIR
jgi:CheY-like chemotaxis protein